MDLPNVFSKFNSKEKPQEKFLAIEIGIETITTAVWQVEEGKTQIVSLGSTEEWTDTEKNDELLSVIDTSLSKALEGVSPEPNKVMFGLQESWVEGESIIKKYSKILKEVCEKFEFEPIGFVVTTEAIVQLLKKQEGTPVSGVLIRVLEAEINLSVVNLGKITGTEIVARSEDIGADVEEGLARFTIDGNLPSRILLFDSNSDLEKLKQDLLSYDWLEKLPFLHYPKVEILSRQTPIKAVAIAGGAEAAPALGFEIIDDDEESEVVEKPSEETPEEELEEEVEPTQKKEDLEQDQNLIMAEASEIGFQLGLDVTKDKKGEELENTQKSDSTKSGTLYQEEPLHKKENKFSSRIKPDLKQKIKTLGLHLKSFIKIPDKKRFGLTDHAGSKVKIIVISSAVFFLLLIIGGVYAYWTVPKASLVLFVRPKTLEKELTITIDPAANQVDLVESIIPGKMVSSEVEGNKEKATTGTRTVGEKATGEVVIYNKTSSVKTFESGTIIIGKDGLKFSLDSSVKVASASAEESDEAVTTVFGKAKTSVTALSIGAEYNLDSGNNFSFELLSTASYDAKNEANFEGGSSREVQAVSEDDIQVLTDELTFELKEKAAQELGKGEGMGMQILTEGAQTEVLSESFSADEGEEAQKVSLSLKLKVSTFAYQEQDFDALLHQSVRESVPENYEIQENESKTEILTVDFEEDSAYMDLIYKVVLIPQIDESEVKRNIIGRYPGVAKEYLEDLPNYSKAEVEITPKSLPAKLKTFPRKPENISIEIKVERDQ